MTIDKSNIKALKSFALTMSWAFPVVFSLALPWLFSYAYQVWPLFISASLMLLYLFKPSWIYWPFKGWMFVAGIIGWVNTRIILGLSFYLLIAPIGMVLNLFGKLQYKKQMPKHQTSSYVKPDEKSKKESLEYPF